MENNIKKKRIEEMFRKNFRSEFGLLSFKWEENTIRIFSQDGTFLEEFEITGKDGQYTLYSKYKHKCEVIRKPFGMWINTLEHYFNLDEKETQKHDIFLETHASCRYSGPDDKIYYYDRSCGFDTWWALHVGCRGCGTNDILVCDDCGV